MVAAQFLRNLIAAVPDAIHTVLIDNGIEHRLTRITHPWTNGQVERMNRTIKEATVKRFHHDDRDQLRQHLQDFIETYNLGRRLKTLKGLTPYEFICKQRTSEPDRFIIDPIHQRPGRNIWMMPASRSRSVATTATPFDLTPRLPTSRRSNCVGPLRCLKVPLPACSTKTGTQITILKPADTCYD